MGTIFLFWPEKFKEFLFKHYENENIPEVVKRLFLPGYTFRKHKLTKELWESPAITFQFRFVGAVSIVMSIIAISNGIGALIIIALELLT
jgi:hypothetical protein